MEAELRQKAEKYYFVLGGVFIASLVACNLMFQKFFYWTPFSFLGGNAQEGSTWHGITHYTFYISVGIIPYPVTFLITDIISEIYGKRRADMVVFAGLIASVFVLLIVWLAALVPATDWSPVDDNTFRMVFGSSAHAVAASMLAYLIAQFIDIRIFHFWKRLTNGRHLWLRNNFSTIPSQFVDTFVVLFVLCWLGSISWERFGPLLINGFIFKAIIAAFDTPFFYLLVWWFRKKFRLKPDEEIVF